MSRLTVLSLVGALLTALLIVVSGPMPTAEAAPWAGKTIVLLGSLGRDLGDTPWETLRQQLAMRGFPDSEIVEFQYAGGGFGLDGVFAPAGGGACESFSKASFLT